MKKFLIATTVAVATTAAFGAASVRAPKATSDTVTTPTATTNTARAGTLRTQTLKSTSVSTPIVTTTSVATPTQSESVESRMALSKGFKNFNPQQVKDKAAAQQELADITAQIEELQTELADAKSKQTTVLTTTNVDDKITASVTEKTYTKTEIDELLNDINRKLPTIDNKGNLNISDSSGTTIAQLLPYNLYSTHKHTNLSNTKTYKLIAPHDFGTSSFGSLAQDYTRDWVSDICATERSNPDLVACGFYNADGKNTAMTEFSTISCFKGMQKISSSVTDDGIQSQYTTFENLTQNQIRNRFCGELSNDECSISGYTETPMGACTEKTFTLTTSEGTVPLYAPSGTVVVVCPDGCHPKVHEGPNGASVSCIDEHGKPCGEKVIADNPSADQ